MTPTSMSSALLLFSLLARGPSYPIRPRACHDVVLLSEAPTKEEGGAGKTDGHRPTAGPDGASTDSTDSKAAACSNVRTGLITGWGQGREWVDGWMDRGGRVLRCVGSWLGARLRPWAVVDPGDPSAKALPPACPVWEEATARHGRIWLLFLWLTKGGGTVFPPRRQCTAHGCTRAHTQAIEVGMGWSCGPPG